MSKIEWTGETWNPIVGCSVVSPGCTNCYAMKDAWRKGFNPKTPQYHGLTRKVNRKPVWTGKVRLAEHKLTEPLKRRKPTTYFVNSMGDLFHEDVPDDWIDRVFAVMAMCPQHTFQPLTKRSARMRDYLDNQGRHREAAIDRAIIEMIGKEDAFDRSPMGGCRDGLPLPNVWLGVSAEDQRRADERIPDLLETPAAVRFVSYEPALGPIDFEHIAHQNGCAEHYYAALSGYVIDGIQAQVDRLDWVIVGGESGPGARPCHVDWIRQTVAQCQDAGLPVFVKQLGPRPYWNGPELRYLVDRKGGDPAEWPADLRVRQMPALLTADR